MSRFNFCGSREHAITRRGFLANGRRDRLRGGHDAARSVAGPRARRRTQEAAEARHPALAGGRAEPAGNLGPQAGPADRRPVPVDPDLVPGVHISELMPKMAAADEAHLHHPLAQHQERRPRRRRQADDARPARRAEPAYPDLGAVLARELGQARQPGARLRLVLLADRGPAGAGRRPASSARATPRWS